jgi:hypothetical protein
MGLRLLKNLEVLDSNGKIHTNTTSLKKITKTSDLLRKN